MAATASTITASNRLPSTYADVGMSLNGEPQSHRDGHDQHSQPPAEFVPEDDRQHTSHTGTLHSHDSQTFHNEKSSFYDHEDQDITPFPTPSSTPVSLIGGDRQSLFGPSRHRHTPHTDDFLQPSTQGRKRGKSFTEVVAEKAIQNLAAPISFPLVALCLSWYATSAISNTLNKSILNIFPYPVTLSLVQFFLAVCFGLSTILLAQNSAAIYKALPAGTVSRSGIRYPTREILASTLPMGIFQLFGHIFSHMATSQIPVSLVHTIKALSPLFTVAAYRLVFQVQYPVKTYFSLIPLTTGVVMTCSTQFSSQMQGILFALIAALIFVSQNIYSKKLLTHRPHSTPAISETGSGNSPPRIDKLNILCYCSSLAFIFTFPLWFFSEGFTLGRDFWNGTGKFFGTTTAVLESGDILDPASFSVSYLISCFIMNGLSHFLQNILAFQVLGMVSPVTYSVASLVKRIVVVTFSIVWFGQRVNALQGWGIMVTFFGLYLYDRLGGDSHKQRKFVNVSLHSQPTLPK